jgi:hypothetical protein
MKKNLENILKYINSQSSFPKMPMVRNDGPKNNAGGQIKAVFRRIAI